MQSDSSRTISRNLSAASTMPLDLLAYPEIIPKAQRIAPNEVLERPSLLPKEKDAVVYCTCPSDKTSRIVLRRAVALQIFRVKFLKGDWRAGRRRDIR